MAKHSRSATVVIVGGGLTRRSGRAPAHRQGHRCRSFSSEARIGAIAPNRNLPSQRDELRWDTHQGLDARLVEAKPTTLRHERNEQALPVRWMEAFLPGTGMGGAANHWNGITWRWAEYDPTLRTRSRRATAKRRFRPICRAGLGCDLRRDGALSRSVRETVRHLRQGRQYPGTHSTRRQSVRGAARDEYPQRPLEITEAGMIFQTAAETMGHKPFPRRRRIRPAFTRILTARSSAMPVLRAL